jgi:hypothetical protein
MMLINTIGRYIIDLQTGQIKNPGYRVYQLSWQTHRKGKAIKTPKEYRRPRRKFIGVWNTEEKAELAIKELQKVIQEL